MTDTLNLSDKAVLIQLSRKRMRTSYRDAEVEGNVRFQYGDESLTTYAHIFQNKTNPGNPVRKALQEYDAAYSVNKKHTSESNIRGLRLLPSNAVFDHMERMNKAFEGVAKQVPYLRDNWDDLVAHDMQCRGHRARIEDYPKAHEVADMFSFDLRVIPLPSHSAMPLNLSPEVQGMISDGIDSALSEVQNRVRSDLIKRMLDPIQRAVERFSVPVGQKGTRFHGDALVGNLREAVELAKELNVVNDPEVAALTAQLEQTLNAHYLQPDTLKHSQTGRDKAKDDLQDILDKMGI
jgi:hypothetical protein